MDKKQITINQHYIPQVYLRGFSSDNKTIFMCRTTDLFQPPDAVTIRSVCSEKYLYELKDDNGNLIWPNHLEKIFSIIEKQFEIYLKKIRSKAFNPQNYSSLCFFTKSEKNFWKSYISLQMMRMPKIISMAAEEIKRRNERPVSDGTLRAMALGECLPFFKKDKDTDYLIFKIRTVLNPMSIALGVDESGGIITSDSPVVSQAPDYNMGSLEKIEFSLNSKLVLFLFGGRLKDQYRKNSLFPLNTDEVRTIQRDIACSAEEWVFSDHQLTELEKEAIQEGRAIKRYIIDNVDLDFDLGSLH